MSDSQSMKGTAIVTLIGPDGEVKSRQLVENIITDVGDSYYATRGIAGVSPALPADVAALADGMKLGSGGGATAESKNGAGAALAGTYIAGSNLAFDSGFPATNNLGPGAGVEAQYQTTWAPGVATNSSIDEAVIVDDAETDATSTAANTIARFVFATAVNKTDADQLVVEWQHLFDGAA